VSEATSAAPICQVMSSPNYEPIAFSDVDRYEAWHGVMRDEIQVLHSNDTWSLDSLHPLMNVIGSWWVYRIKRYVNGNIEQYKVRLVTKGFTLQENIDYSKTFSPVIK